MNINELFVEYLNALLEQSDIEEFNQLVEWLNSDEDTDLLSESHMNLELPQNPPTSFGIDSKREDLNQAKKSKSESYESVRKKLLDMTGHLDEAVANAGATKYLDAVLKYDKDKYGKKPKKTATKKSKSKELNDKGPIGKRKKKGAANLKSLVAARRKRKKPEGKKKVSTDNKPGGKTGKKTGRKFEPKGSNSASAKRFISYRSSKEGERKHPAPRAPEQSGRVKGKVDGDLKGRFERYYGKEKGEAIRHAVAVKIARGDQNLSGLEKGRGRKGGGGGRKESQTTKNLKADTNDSKKLKTLRRLQAAKRRKG